MKIFIFAVLLAFISPGLAIQPVLAFRGGDILLRIGPTTVDPTDVESDTLTLNGGKLPGT